MPRPTRPRLVLLALLALSLLPAGLRQAGANEATNRAVNAAVRATKRSCGSLGVHVLDVATGRTVYEYNADQRRIIASNTKLFTTAAALDRLGPGHFFETEVLIDGRVSGGALEGDLMVIGGGDPNISGRHHQGDAFAVFRRWTGELRRRGIWRVAGDLVLVDGLFEGPVVHPDWPRDQLAKWYEAPVAALSFSDSCALVRIWPNGASGTPAQVDVLPRVPFFDVDVEAVTTSSARSHRVGVTRQPEGDRLRVWGAVYRGAGPVETWVAVSDPVRYFGLALKRALEEEGVTVEGRVRVSRERPAGDWRRLAVHRSDLMSTLEVINKRSQNFYAESVLKLLGARGCGRGSWEAGLRVVADFLRSRGLEPGTYSMADGSGMSRNNRFTPRQLTALLAGMLDHRHSTEFLRSLPYSGEEGLSWEKRLAAEPYRGNVFAKTGRLSGVSALSGYAKGASGRIYAFSVLCNGARNEWGARAGQDDIVRAVVRNG